MLFPDTVIGVTIEPDRVLPEFLELEWAQRGVRRQIERSARTTSGVFKVNQAALAKVMLRVLPLAMQRAFRGELTRHV